MGKTRLGFDIGNSSVKVAAVSRDKAEVFEIRMPDNMMQEGEITMPNSFSGFLREERKKHKIPKGECALVMPARQVICRTVTLPKMSAEQLMLNLPYEFSEFIQGDADRFFCDYAMCEPSGDDRDGEEQMTLIAAAAAKDRILQYTRLFAGAGLKLRALLPGEMALIRMTALHRQKHPEGPQEYCFINLGWESVLITIVKRDRIQAMRQINLGCRQLDMVIADLVNEDPFLAASYKFNNYQNVLDAAECEAVYSNIAVEILKVVNFYRFNYRDSQLAGVYLTGGGSSIPQLCGRIEEMLGLAVLPVTELFDGYDLKPESAAKGILALSVALAQTEDR